MRHFLSFLALLVLPLPVSAIEREGGGDFSPLAIFVQMLASLALVVGLIFLFYHLYNRWLKTGRGAAGRPQHIRVVETRYMAPKKSLLLVEVGGEYLLLSDCSEGVRFIKQIDIREELEGLAATGRKGTGHGMPAL